MYKVDDVRGMKDFTTSRIWMVAKVSVAMSSLRVYTVTREHAAMAIVNESEEELST